MNIVYRQQSKNRGMAYIVECDGWFYVWCDGMEYDFFITEIEAYWYFCDNLY